MEVRLKQIQEFVKNKTREKWLLDPIIRKFVDTDSDKKAPDSWKPAFIQNFEIYLGKKLIGDIKVFGNDKDTKKRVAQFLMVLGDNRGEGVGSKALSLLLEKLKKCFPLFIVMLTVITLPA